MLYIKTANGWKLWLAAETPCVNSNDLQGVFSNTTLEEARMETALHAAHYEKCVNKFLNGDYPGTGNERYNAMRYDISRFKMFGAFGEKL